MRPLLRSLLRSPAGLAGAVIVAAFVVLAVIGPVLWGDRAAHVDATAILQGSSNAHLLGTDGLGRDIFARVLVAARLSLVLSLLATLTGAVLGIGLGSLPSILPRRSGRLVAGVLNALVAFPGLLLALFTTVIMGLGAKGAVIGIGAAIAPVLARLTHTLTASVAGSDYVAAARVLGLSRRRILTRHILPNVAEPLILNVTMIMGSALLGLAGLSFLGLGVQAPSYDWGRMLSDGLQRIYVTPAVALGPALAIMLAGIGFNLVGESLARAASRERSGENATRSAAPAIDPAPAPVEAATDRQVPDVLDVRNLTVSFPGGVTPVRDVSLRVGAGEIVGVVGESGSGKSMTALAIGRLVPFPGTARTTRHAVAGTELGELSTGAQRRLLATTLAMVFQDPMASLNPALRVGGQLAEVSTVHGGLARRPAWQRAVERLRLVHIGDAERRARQRPHEFSGGMRQRAVIAMGTMGEPRLLIADEPTTALDVTVQRQILDLLREVTDKSGAGALFISHDMAVVSQLCHRVVVMYDGRVVEELPTVDLDTAPRHPYTRALIASLPDMQTDRSQPLTTIPGRPPSPTDNLPGCSFAPRCEFATAQCATARPQLERVSADQQFACWNPQHGPVLHRAAAAEEPA